jgi:hypothetical protein
VFVGTAPPGTKAGVQSPYGQGQADADASGSWRIEVAFPGAPVGKAFTVYAGCLATQQKWPFTFTRTA